MALNDIANRPTLNTLVQLLTNYHKCRKAGNNHKRSVHYSFVQTVGYMWHSGSKHFAVNPKLASVKRSKWYRGIKPPKIDVSVTRFHDLFVRVLGGPVSLSPLHTPEAAVVAAVKRYNPKLWEQLCRARKNYKAVTGRRALKVEVWLFTPGWRQWITCRKARQLFVRGWGKFDVAAAVLECTDDIEESVYRMQYRPTLDRDELTKQGYGFHNREGLQLAKSKPFRQWFTRHWQWWRQNLARIDELAIDYRDRHHKCPVAAAYLREHPDCTPPGLLTHIGNLRQQQNARREAEFGNQYGPPPNDIRYNWLANVPVKVVEVDGQPATLRPIATSGELVEVADSLDNCAANYHHDLIDRQCMLVALVDQNGKAIGLGELLPNGQWGQISGPENAKLPAAVKKLFKEYTPDAMLAVWVGDVSTDEVPGPAEPKLLPGPVEPEYDMDGTLYHADPTPEQEASYLEWQKHCEETGADPCGIQ